MTYFLMQLHFYLYTHQKLQEDLWLILWFIGVGLLIAL